MGAGMVVKF